MKLNLLYVSSQKNKNALFLEDDLVKRIKSPLKLELKKIFCKTESNNIEQQKNFESEQIKNSSTKIIFYFVLIKTEINSVLKIFQTYFLNKLKI